MSMLTATLALDVRLQARSKLYAIGIGVSLALGLLGRFLIGPEHAATALPILYLLGLGGSTYIFGASMMLLEKSEGTLRALRTTPLTSRVYLGSKILTLGAFAALEGVIVHAVGFFEAPMSIWPLLLGVGSLVVFDTLLGLGQVASHDSVFSFLVPGALVVGSVLQWPMLYVLDVGPPLLWFLFPTQGPLLLMMGAFTPLPAWQWVYAILMTAASLGLTAWWARARFARHIGLKGG